MTRGILATALLILLPAVAFAQVPQESIDINVLYTTTDSVWVSVTSPISGSFVCWNWPDGWRERRLAVVPCPAVDTSCAVAVLAQCDPLTQTTYLRFCGEPPTLVLGLSCTTTYSLFSYRMLCGQYGKPPCVLDPRTTDSYIARTYTPSVPGCEPPAVGLGACCLHFAWDGACIVTTALGCEHAPPAGGIYTGDGTSCQPVPPCIVPVGKTSWGRVKSI
jgi:hypothetical protein